MKLQKKNIPPRAIMVFANCVVLLASVLVPVGIVTLKTDNRKNSKLKNVSFDTRIRRTIMKDGAIGCAVFVYLILALIVSGVVYGCINQDLRNLTSDEYYSRAFPFWAVFLIVVSIIPLLLSFLFAVDKIIRIFFPAWNNNSSHGGESQDLSYSQQGSDDDYNDYMRDVYRNQ